VKSYDPNSFINEILQKEKNQCELLQQLANHISPFNTHVLFFDNNTQWIVNAQII
jgi:hypothetical protein